MSLRSSAFCCSLAPTNTYCSRLKSSDSDSPRYRSWTNSFSVTVNGISRHRVLQRHRWLGRRRVDTRVPFWVALIDVLEYGRALLLVKGSGIGRWEAGVQSVFDGEPELRSSRGFLPPVQDEQLLEPLQKVAGDPLQLGALLGAQVRRGACQDI